MLYNRDIRDLLDMKLFVDCDSDTRLSRRGQEIYYVDLGAIIIIVVILSYSIFDFYLLAWLYAQCDFFL